jgi:transcriptional regulator of acetoin/glycerol metabolism
VNCGAIPEGTIDSELFGHEKVLLLVLWIAGKDISNSERRNYIPRMRSARCRSAQQARLLRVLETGEFNPVYGSSKVQKTDVYVLSLLPIKIFSICISKNKFREDLYYRLSHSTDQEFLLCATEKKTHYIVQKIFSRLRGEI